MSDLEKLFENAPECATEIVAWGNNLTWANKTKMYSLVREYWVERESGWATIATRPEPRKTVEDAVEWNKLSGHDVTWAHEECDIITFDPSCDISYSKTEYDKSEGEYVICTREEFEACVAAKSEPEWTHGIPPNEIYCKVNHGGEFVNCYLIGRDDMGAFVYRIDGQYYSTMSESKFKPIKPTITEKERETVAKFVARIYTKDDCDLRKEFDDFISEHEVVE